MPYRAWLTISNDPDQTDHDAWTALQHTVWDTLRLPLADSFFLYNFNEHLPDQVSMESHPEIASARPHDTMHTWGDFMNSRTVCFTREHARRGLASMKQLGLEPTVWTDHDAFVGNMLHASDRGSRPSFRDASGYERESFEYTLDLAWEAGVRYMWDGGLSPVLGHDRPISRREWYGAQTGSGWKGALMALTDRVGSPLWAGVRAKRFTWSQTGGAQYSPRTFADGRRMYTFQRHGRWDLADIDGLATLIGPASLDRLVEVQGTCVIYTHLGKRPAGRQHDPRHIPESTLASLQNLERQYAAKRVMVSSTSRMLDYLVLRDHARVTDGSIEFRADGIRFETLSANDVRAFTFGYRTTRGRPAITVGGRPVDATFSDLGDGYGTVCFDSP